ncbi:uncharacterized protein BDZ83DRAFT_604750 [Colletotrichum acutatum]|uniref:Uncharacterized protein n=1 Tax=Glomerella acutata TaxID=27357 RepID=A0AAD8XLV8_GLOAC|nr:uncharacterized protein BDZ83DRAFT_604750 [Colletotrichum acutatum]KAK1729708.1 hypothetical protein BDZ83DRAFT_604750 [Colletotrichum acutatum]
MKRFWMSCGGAISRSLPRGWASFPLIDSICLLVVVAAVMLAGRGVLPVFLCLVIECVRVWSFAVFSLLFDSSLSSSRC